ncbi:hypothetical protein HMPREF0742_00169 [Rothia aeria F0184]|uniref:Uncharacterized protein n=1 Tax=Rothia aeria F0184 TaxID=888019 RepID=U7V7A1_9MICC|nr:hypothetical protein HMPREF0742_00169 [Rothia aeria F0184]
MSLGTWVHSLWWSTEIAAGRSPVRIIGDPCTASVYKSAYPYIHD